jgi:hypothetical protein
MCFVVLSVAGGSHLRFPLPGLSPKLQTSWPREDRSTPEASIISAVVDELLWIRGICHPSWPSSASEVLSVYWQQSSWGILTILASFSLFFLVALRIARRSDAAFIAASDALPREL